MISRTVRGNYQKHRNPNPIQRWLISRFHARVHDLVSQALPAARASMVMGTNVECCSLLDVGCGEGYVISYLREHLPGLTITGMDYDAEAIEIARQLHPDLNLKSGDASNLPFSDSSFDAVICLEVLEHLGEPENALRELIRVSRQYVILSVPNQPFFALANFLRGKNLSRFGEDPEHVQHWTGRGFLDFLNGKIEIVRVNYSFPWIIVLGATPGHKTSKVSR